MHTLTLALTANLVTSILPQCGFCAAVYLILNLIGVAVSRLKTTFKRFNGQKYIRQRPLYHFQGLLGELNCRKIVKFSIPWRVI